MGKKGQREHSYEWRLPRRRFSASLGHGENAREFREALAESKGQRSARAMPWFSLFRKLRIYWKVVLLENKP
eukprot:1374302-Amorphochlora_amoeboformis.AAC.1